MKRQVEEQRLMNAVEYFRDTHNQEPEILLSALKKGQKFKDEGLTPFYIVNEEKGTFFVTSQEMMDKKFH